jgi:hypothetical protein
MLIYINSLFYGLVFSENAFYGAFANNSIQKISEVHNN